MDMTSSADDSFLSLSLSLSLSAELDATSGA